MSHDVFLSYSHADEEFAMRLFRRLRRFRSGGKAVRVFFAPAAISPGESIPRALSNALKDCQHLVAVVSPSWVESEWCRLEHETTVWRDPGTTERRLLPCLVADTELPAGLSHISYIDFRQASQFDACLRVLVSAIRVNDRERERRNDSVLAQRAVLHAPLLPWIGFGGPSFDFLWPEMIIDPAVTTRRHPGPRASLSSWLGQDRVRDQNLFAIVGDAGAGKSTILRCALLNGGRRLPPQRLLVHARELLSPSQDLTEQVEAGEPSGVALLVDGLDEAGADNLPVIIEELTRLRRASTLVVIATRTDFFEKQYDVLGTLLTDLVDIVEIEPWSDDDILEFSSKYAERLDLGQLVSSVKSILEVVPGSRPLLSNPMRLTLVLFLLASGLDLTPTSLQQPFTLYALFYEEWLKKERQRGTGGRDGASVRSAHVAVARWLYEHRGGRVELSHILASADVSLTDLANDSAFTGLLEIRSGFSADELLSGFRHETLGEFLIAADILDAFSRGGSSIDEALDVTVGDDVNRFVRSGFLEAARHRLDTLLQNLSARYQALMADGLASGMTQLETENAERTREQILYYIGRLPIAHFPAILRTAFEGESSSLLRRSAALGAILHGADDIEERYLRGLESPEEARLNRSVQMVYFGDVHGDLHTFRDGGQSWDRTRSAIFERLQMIDETA